MRALVARLDSIGDVLVCGPAIRAVAAGAEDVTFLVGPRGRSAAELLPGVDRIEEWCAPWIDPEPPPVRQEDISHLLETLRGVSPDAGVIFTSHHQSALPLALILRLAGVPRVYAVSDDYPGSLLDLRHRVPDDIPEPERALSIAEVAGFVLPAGDDGRLAVRRPLPDVTALTGAPGYVAVHPGASVPARAWTGEHCAKAVQMLSERDHRVVVTGNASERALTAYVAGDRARDLGGRTSLAELAAVLDQAAAVVVGNTGPAHLAAAVGTPVVSLFAPTVPAARWLPYKVPTVMLGDQEAPCRDTRARECPVPGHPCLASVSPQDVADAVEELTSREVPA